MTAVRHSVRWDVLAVIALLLVAEILLHPGSWVLACGPLVRGGTT